MARKNTGELLEVKIISFYGRIVFQEKVSLRNKKEIQKMLNTLKETFGIDLNLEEEKRWFG